jgi:fatty acid-binding protein DegV
LAIAHSASGKDAEEFAEGLSHLCPDPPLIIDVTTTIGAHIGPGALGVIALKQSP